jgi:hypothetical protein
LENENGARLPLTDASGHATWTADSGGGDLAAVPLTTLQGSIPAPPKNTVQTIGISDFAQSGDLYEGESVFLYGFPGFVDTAHLTIPITRSGIVAWTNPGGADQSPFLIDAAIFPGNSGGPVFKVPSGVGKTGGLVVGNRILLLGIVTATYQAPIPIAISTGNTRQIVRVPGLGSLGIVEPITRVSALLHAMNADFSVPSPRASSP